MVSLLDPTLQRLVEVNPVSEESELPPISDDARLEAILERGRSEPLRPRSGQQRAWRPGLAVAAAAFVVVLITIGVLSLFTGMSREDESPVVTEPSVVTTVAPVPTTATTLPVPPSSYEVSIASVLPEGTFTASGPAVDAGVMCGAGMDTTESEGEPVPGGTQLEFVREEEHTLVCADGTGEMRLSVDLRGSWGPTNRVYNGRWKVIGGSGLYEGLRGSGELTGGGVDGNRSYIYEFAGSLERSATEATTTTTVPPVVEQYDVAIIHPEGEPFSVSGPAVDAGLACAEGTIGTVTISRQSLASRFPLGGEYSDHYMAVEEHTLACGDGGGSIVLAVRVNQAQLMSGYLFTGWWWVVRGTDEYEGVGGGGDLVGGCDADRSNCSYEYTGHIDRSRDLGITPIVAASTGRHDATMTSEGTGEGGWFDAAGSAVESGLLCPQGVMLAIDETLEGVGEWEHTFFCENGARVTLGIGVRERQSAVVNEYLWAGRWVVIGGAGGYESVTGSGELSGANFEGDWAWEYTGYLEIPE